VIRSGDGAGGTGGPGGSPTGAEAAHGGELKLGSLYQQLILEHYRSPRNRGALEGATATAHVHNPTCGDEVLLMLRLEDGRIAEARFQGQGCSISQASISMMTGLLRGKTPEEALALADRFTEMMKGDAAAARDRELGDLRALEGVGKFPVRIRCALLAVDAVREGLKG
jgi:nitrogen fixation protein NifU and related proteins